MCEKTCDVYTLVTGASSGLGKYVALLLSKDRNVIVSGRDLDRLNGVASECMKNGNRVIIFPFDLSNPDHVANALSKALANNNARVNAFVHCAGITEVLPIGKTKYSIGLKVMNVNYFSATEIISTLLKRKINNKSLQNIIFLTSIAATQGAPHQPHYCASKGALEALRITLARDLAPDIRVNAIAPGSFPTPMWQTPMANDDIKENWKPPTLLSPGAGHEVAEAVKFLLSKEASYLTGVLLPVNGGELLYR